MTLKEWSPEEMCPTQMKVQLKKANRESEPSLSEHFNGLAIGSFLSGPGRFGKPFRRACLALAIFILSNGSMQLGQGQRGFEVAPVAEISQNNKPGAATKKPLKRDLSDYQVTEMGPHHRKWQRIETITNPLGVTSRIEIVKSDVIKIVRKREE